jgi:8-oxo-dGTP pyrophosphatase MutT (NUDIX family)
MQTLCYDGLSGQMVFIPDEKITVRPAVYAVIQSQDNFLFVKNKKNHKLWFVGGGIERGESHQRALVREIEEETGLRIKINQCSFLIRHDNFYYHSPEDYAFKSEKYVYHILLSEKPELKDECEDQEVFGARWYNLQQLESENTFQIDFVLPTLYELVKNY